MNDFDENDEAVRSMNMKYWVEYRNAASIDYTNKIHTIRSYTGNLGAFHHDNTFHGHLSTNHVIYKLGDPLMSADGKHGYEFLVEYDQYQPTVGIYYGVKGLIFDHDNPSAQIEIINQEWQTLMPIVTQMLNNIFPGNDFAHRFKKTDNANNFTYWPFWITVYENEPIEMAAYAVTTIKNIYTKFLNNTLGDMVDLVKAPQQQAVQMSIMSFTNEAFDALISYFTEQTGHDEKYIRSMFNRFIDILMGEKLLKRVDIYECAYAWIGKDMTDFAFVVVEFIHKIANGKNVHTPWDALNKTFLSSDYRRMDNLSRLYGNKKDKKGKASKASRDTAATLLASIS
jgi:hypothetical protein